MTEEKQPQENTIAPENAEKFADTKTDAAVSTKEEKKPAKKSGKKNKRHIPLGKAFITATYNNTIVTFADMQGNALSQSSAGRCGFKGPKKSTPYAAGIIVRAAAEKVLEFGLKDVHVYVKGIGSGRDGALRALNSNGFNIISISDTTPVPHNGCRPKKARRV